MFCCYYYTENFQDAVSKFLQALLLMDKITTQSADVLEIMVKSPSSWDIHRNPKLLPYFACKHSTSSDLELAKYFLFFCEFSKGEKRTCLKTTVVQRVSFPSPWGVSHSVSVKINLQGFSRGRFNKRAADTISLVQGIYAPELLSTFFMHNLRILLC